MKIKIVVERDGSIEIIMKQEHNIFISYFINNKIKEFNNYYYVKQLNNLGVKTILAKTQTLLTVAICFKLLDADVEHFRRAQDYIVTCLKDVSFNAKSGMFFKYSDGIMLQAIKKLHCTDGCFFYKTEKCTKDIDFGCAEYNIIFKRVK
jgi:hypothetical protein